MSVFPLLYLCSGVVLNMVSQLITDTRFSDPSAHIVPFVKFGATLVGAALRRPPRATASREQARLMAAIGLLDASAYTVYCLGFFRLVSGWRAGLRRLPRARPAMLLLLLWQPAASGLLPACLPACPLPAAAAHATHHPPLTATTPLPLLARHPLLHATPPPCAAGRHAVQPGAFWRGPAADCLLHALPAAQAPHQRSAGRHPVCWARPGHPGSTRRLLPAWRRRQQQRQR